MARVSIWLGLLWFLTCQGLFAVENVSTGIYNETAPTSSDIPNWQTGWQQPAVQPTGYTYTTGWNYVGTTSGAGGASATYLGNGWFITAAHVGAGDVKLNGITYPMVPGSAQNFTATTGTVTAQIDVTVFQVSPSPALPALPLRTSDPVTGTHVVMIGFGDGGSKTNETWGYDWIDAVNYFPITPPGTTLESNDFISLEGTDSNGQNNSGNVYELVGGDSGGADFIYNQTSRRWELAGINEVMLTVTYGNGATQQGSGFVQLNTYLAQIEQAITPAAESATDTPTMPQWALIVLGVMLGLAAVPRGMPRRE